jgi:LysM repeat protein
MILKTARFAWVILLLLYMQPADSFRVLAQSTEAYGLVDAVNAYRESIGLPRLLTSGSLMVAAQRHAEWMAANYTYTHTGEGGSMPQDRARAAGFTGTVSENVAGGTDATPAEAIFFWDQSYGHRITMRESLATHIGGGFAANTEQRLFVLLIGTAPGQALLPTTLPIAGGTPAIGYTPPPGMVWSANGEMHQGSDYNPVVPSVGQQSAPTEVAYVMPFDLIRLAEPRPDGSIVHVVEMGQTAWAIAARYHVDLQDIVAINHLSDPPILHPGDTLIIRLGEGQVPPPAPTLPTTHQVQANESLWTIAARYNRSVEELRTWNNLSAADVIKPGDVLVISPPTPPPSEPPVPTAAPSSTLVLSPSPTPLPATLIVAAVPSEPLNRVGAQVTPAPLRELTESTTSPEKDSAVRLLMVLGALALVVTMLAGAILLWLVWKSRHPSFSGNNSRSRSMGMKG